MQNRLTFTSLRSSLRSSCLFVPICLSHLFPVWQSLFALPWLPLCVPRSPAPVAYLHYHSWNLIPHIISAPLDTCTTFCLCHSQESAGHASCTGFLCIASLVVCHKIPIALWAAKEPSLPLTSLEEIGKKWHILATGAVSALYGICVRVALFKGSLISKMRMEDTFHFQDSFKSGNP